MKNAEAILTRLGITEYKESKDEYLCYCILCGDQKYNLQINFNKLLWHCWNCDEGGTLFGLLYIVCGIKRKQAVKLFKLDQINVGETLKTVLGILDPKKARYYYYEKFLVSSRYKYWDTRNINTETVVKYNLGFDKITNRLVIPLMENRKCIGLTRRAIFSEQRPKYLDTKGYDKKKFLYGWDQLDFDEDTVIVTEGPIDTLAVSQLDYNVVGLMGSDLTDYNAKRLAQQFPHVALMLDNDEKGEQVYQDMGLKIMGFGSNSYRIEYETDDPGEIVDERQIKSYTPIFLF